MYILLLFYAENYKFNVSSLVYVNYHNLHVFYKEKLKFRVICLNRLKNFDVHTLKSSFSNF